MFFKNDFEFISPEEELYFVEVEGIYYPNSDRYTIQKIYITDENEGVVETDHHYYNDIIEEAYNRRYDITSDYEENNYYDEGVL